MSNSTLKSTGITKQEFFTEQQVLAELTDFHRIPITRNCSNIHCQAEKTQTVPGREKIQIDGPRAVHCSSVPALHIYFRFYSLQPLQLSQTLIQVQMAQPKAKLSPGILQLHKTPSLPARGTEFKSKLLKPPKMSLFHSSDFH